MALLDLLQGDGQQIVASCMHAFGGKPIFFHNLAHTLSAARVNGDHSFEILMAQVVSLDTGKLVIYLRTCGDLDEVDRRNARQGRFDPVNAGLNVRRARCRDEPGNMPRGDERGNTLAHLYPGLEEVLPNVSQATVRAASRDISVVSDNGNTRVECSVHR